MKSACTWAKSILSAIIGTKKKSSLCLFLLLSFDHSAWADTSTTRPYKISVLIFKHLPAGKNTAANTDKLWSNKTFEGSTFITSVDENTLTNYDTLLPSNQSALIGSYNALSHDSNYQIIYSAAWLTQFEYGQTRSFHFHEAFPKNDHALDGLLQITMKFYFDVHFQTQYLTPSMINNHLYYTIDALNESYQIPSNQLQYIDGPIYGALVSITKVT